MEKIVVGTSLAKPVVTQTDCNTYAAMARAVDEHNTACVDGDTRWRIEDSKDAYIVAAVPPPTTEELAALEKAKEEAAAKAAKEEELNQLPGRMDALEAANDDIVLMMADLIGG